MIVRIGLVITLAFYLGQEAIAANITWSGADGADWNTSGTPPWSNGTKPLSTDTAIFSAANSSIANAVADQTITSITFNGSAGTNGGTFTIGATGGNSLILSHGGIISLAAAMTGTGKTISINSPIVLTPASGTTAGSYTFTSTSADSTNTLNFGGAISGATTTNTETLTLNGGNTGNNFISGVISNGNAATFAVTKSGAGTWTLSGNNSYNGLTTVSAGTLTLSGNNSGAGGVTASGTSRININHAGALGSGTLTTAANTTIDNTSGGSITLSTNNTIALGSGLTFGGTNDLTFGTGGITSPFSGTITLNGTGRTLTFGGAVTNTATVNSSMTVNGVGNTLVLGGLALNADTVSARTNSFQGSANITITGPVTGGGRVDHILTYSATGTLTLQGTNTYTGQTRLDGGTVVLDFSGASSPTNDILVSGNSVRLGSGTLSIKGKGGSTSNSQTIVLTQNSGSGVNHIIVNDNGSSGTTTLALDNTGLGTRANKVTINIDLSQGLGGNAAGNVITTTATTATLGYVTVKDASGTGFGKYSGSNVVKLTGQTTLANNSNASGTDFITSPGGTSTTGSPYLQLNSALNPTWNSLTIDTSSATGANFLDLNSNTVSLTQKGLLMVGSNHFTIQNGQVGASNTELIVHTMGAGKLTIAGTLSSGTGSLTKSGSGMLILSGANTYTGATSINQGTLLVSGSLGASTAVTIEKDGILAGSGTVSGTVSTVVGATSVIDPSDSVGTGIGQLTIGTLTSNNGGVYKFTLGANTTAGTTYDQVAVTGVFTGSGAAGELHFNFTDAGAQTGVNYTLFTFASSTGLDLTDFTIDTAGWAGTFTINATDLTVNFTNIPEPSTWGMLGMALGMLGLCWKRRVLV